MKKKIYLLIFLSLVSIVLFGCGGKNSDDKTSSSSTTLAAQKYEQITEDNFNRDLFYMNTLEFEVADPTIIYAEEGEGAGYFYAFGTSDLIGCHGIQCWRSKDLANWEYTGVALQPDPLDTWAVNNYWAPEIIFDEEYGLYFLFYNADRIGTSTRCISVAYSENVMGPYTIPDGFENADGLMLEANKPVVDFHANKNQFNYPVRESAIDASPFIDPVSGERYLYWSWYDGRQEIFGMKMTDWFTPQYDTVVQVTQLERTTVGGDVYIQDGFHALNEGPFMYYKDGTYFLTYSVYPYTDSNYQVRLALSDNPLTGFEKVPLDDGGVVLATDPSWSHINSAGHHQFVEVGDQLLVVYHTFYDRSTIAEGRALAIDEVVFIENSKGQLTIHANGPTYSIQPIPSILSGYSDVADKATVEATNVKEGSSKEYLNDGIIKLKDSDLAKETEFNEGTAKITFKFEEAQQLKAVMVYNSYNIDTAFGMYPDYGEIGVKSIDLEYVCDVEGNTKVAHIDEVLFDTEFYTLYQTEIFPSGAAIAEFEDLPVVKVTITMENELAYSISEIKLLAANKKTVAYKSELANEYTYNNDLVLNHYVNEGVTLGGTEYYDATYGWDLTTDDGTKNAYTTAHGIGDSYVYFKDVTATTFYAEGYISTFSHQSYVMGGSPDRFPKIGMVIRNREACMFFYIDAAEKYTLKQVGYTQSTYGNSGVWDWEATEQLEEIDIVYRNSELNLEDNYVKMALLRVGAKVYMLINDEIVFETEELRGLTDSDLASVGFLGFSTPMVIKDYSVETNVSKVNEILAGYLSQSTGATFGDGTMANSTSGWDLSHDLGTADSYVTSNKLNDAYLFFKETGTTKFYAEAKIATTSISSLNNDNFPKLGLVIRNKRACTFFYVDGSSNYTANTVGYVQSAENVPGQWQWDGSVEKQCEISYRNETLDLSGEFVKLAILRDGNEFYMFVNDELVFTVSDLISLGAEDDANVGLLCFNTQLVAKDYFLTTDDAKVNEYLALVK